MYCMCTCLVDDLSGEVMVAPSKKLEDLIHLAELCVDLLQQNEEHYAEVGHTHMSGWLVKLKKGNLIWSSYLVYN